MILDWLVTWKKYQLPAVFGKGGVTVSCFKEKNLYEAVCYTLTKRNSPTGLEKWITEVLLTLKSALNDYWSKENTAAQRVGLILIFEDFIFNVGQEQTDFYGLI